MCICPAGGTTGIGIGIRGGCCCLGDPRVAIVGDVVRGLSVTPAPAYAAAPAAAESGARIGKGLTFFALDMLPARRSGCSPSILVPASGPVLPKAPLLGDRTRFSLLLSSASGSSGSKASMLLLFRIPLATAAAIEAAFPFAELRRLCRRAGVVISLVLAAGAGTEKAASRPANVSSSSAIPVLLIFCPGPARSRAACFALLGPTRLAGPARPQRPPQRDGPAASLELEKEGPRPKSLLSASYAEVRPVWFCIRATKEALLKFSSWPKSSSAAATVVIEVCLAASPLALEEEPSPFVFDGSSSAEAESFVTFLFLPLPNLNHLLPCT